MAGDVYLFVALIPSIVLHEVSHGYVAFLFGDPTAKENHRLTLNPFRHVDIFGSLIMPALLIAAGLPPFGYAKPVPVDFTRLRNPRRQAFWVSMAGPAVNIGLCVVAYVVCKFDIHYFQNQVLLNVGVYFGIVNITLAAFNLIPIPPLDGSAIVERLLPRRAVPSYYKLRAVAFPLLIGLLILDNAFFHVGGSILGGLQNWWLNRVF